MVRGPVDLPEKFSVCLNEVQIAHNEIEGAMACVLQPFIYTIVRSPLFTQRNFFSESGISMLKKAVPSARIICERSWRESIEVCAGSVISDLKACREKVVVSRKTSKESRGRWFDADSVVSSLVEKGTTRGGRAILDDSNDVGLPGTSRSQCSLGKGKKRRSSASPNLKKNFSVASRPLLRHHL